MLVWGVEQMTSEIRVRWLGRVAYTEALRLQEEIVGRNAADELLLLEHEPAFTIGRTQDQSSLRDSRTLPAPMTVINRGAGDAAWAGQLVGYPLLNLGRRGANLHRYLRVLEDFVIAICGEERGAHRGGASCRASASACAGDLDAPGLRRTCAGRRRDLITLRRVRSMAW